MDIIYLQGTLELSCPKYLWNSIKSTSVTERLLCSGAIIILSICVGLIVYFTMSANEIAADINIGSEDWNVSRVMWLATPWETVETTEEFEPLRLVVIQHTVSQECHRFIICSAELRTMQSWFLKDFHYDIPYNFMIGNDGRVYEGRGWGKVGAHTQFYNRCSLGIGFIGDYREELPLHSQATVLQLNRTKSLLEYGVEQGYLHPEYKVVAAKDIQSTASPGSNLYNAISAWTHFDNGVVFRNRSCEEIYALFQDMDRQNNNKTLV